jgi:EpsI family protein
LLVTATGGDRHRAHPPEYCLTGGGWQVTARREADILVAGQALAASRLDLHQRDENLAFVYWFTDGTTVCPSYSALLREDTWRRLIGRRTNWFLIRAYAPTASAVDDFLAHLVLVPAAQPALTPSPTP